jgi:hypothetical protein
MNRGPPKTIGIPRKSLKGQDRKRVGPTLNETVEAYRVPCG